MLAANQTADAAASAAAVQVTNPMSLESIIRLPPSPLFSNYPIWKRGKRGKVNQHVASSHTYKKKPSLRNALVSKLRVANVTTDQTKKN